MKRRTLLSTLTILSLAALGFAGCASQEKQSTPTNAVASASNASSSNSETTGEANVTQASKQTGSSSAPAASESPPRPTSPAADDEGESSASSSSASGQDESSAQIMRKRVRKFNRARGSKAQLEAPSDSNTGQARAEKKSSSGPQASAGQARAKKKQPSGSQASSGGAASDGPSKPNVQRFERKAKAKREEPRPEPKRPSGPQYQNYGYNEFEATSEDAKSTFAVDVDTGSYTRSRRVLKSGRTPPPAAVRVEEFVNYFDYGYPSPEEDAFGVHVDAAPSPFAEKKDRYLMRVGVQGRRIPKSERKPVHLTFLVDVSGSMGDSDKLPLAKKSLRILTRHLKEGDTVAIATYSGGSKAVLEPTGIDNRERILASLDRLSAGGSTAMSSGLDLAYNLALRNFHPKHVNRVVVVSDGDANVGASSHEAILDKIQNYVERGVRLSTIGFGTGNYRDTMMEQLADNGNGNYFYVDGIGEAKRIFGKELVGTLQIIAKDVKIQIEFNEKAVPRYRLIGYENRDVKDKNFRNEKVDAGEIGAGHTVTALYEIEVDASATRPLATVRVRHKTPRGQDASEQSFTYRSDQIHQRLSAASTDFQFAAAVGGFAERLRQSPYAENLSYKLIEEVAASTTEGRDRRERFVELVRRAEQLNSK